jgi:hypothetical protein
VGNYQWFFFGKILHTSKKNTLANPTKGFWGNFKKKIAIY